MHIQDEILQKAAIKILKELDKGDECDISSIATLADSMIKIQAIYPATLNFDRKNLSQE